MQRLSGVLCLSLRLLSITQSSPEPTPCFKLESLPYGHGTPCPFKPVAELVEGRSMSLSKGYTFHHTWLTINSNL